jgi:TPR repeat protein
MARFEASMVETVEVAAGGGTSDGLFQLGLMHCVGRDVPLDLIIAHKWFNLAALRGNAEAKRYRMEIAGEMSRSEVAEAQRQAREWLRRH